MKLNLVILLLLSFVSTNVFAKSCWPPDERRNVDDFSELQGVLIISLKDAVNCKPVSGANLTLGKNSFTSDEKGYVQLPMEGLDEIMDMRIPLKIEHPDYITLNTNLIVAAGTVLNRRMVMSRKLPPGELRFVLSWGEYPEDLDLHLTGDGFHISYRNMRSVTNRAKLDRDALEGYGPETITLHRALPGKTYKLVVDNYSGEDSFSGAETVSVYNRDQLVKTIELPKGSHRAVHVLTISNSEIHTINKPVARPK